MHNHIVKLSNAYIDYCPHPQRLLRHRKHIFARVNAMNIWIISASVLASICAFSFAIRSSRKVGDMNKQVDDLSSQIREQAAAFVEAKSALQELKNEVYGNSRREQPTADSTSSDPIIPISTEQAESLRNTAQIMQDAAEPATYDDPKKWDDI